MNNFIALASIGGNLYNKYFGDNMNAKFSVHLSQKEMLEKIMTLSKTSLSSSPDHRVSFVDNVFVDLDFFHNNDNDTDKSVYSYLNKTRTIFGDYLLKELITHPTSDISTLHKRQRIIGKLIHNQKIHQIINNLKTDGKDLLWYWQPISEENETLHDMIYYKYPVLKLINKRPLILSLSNFYKIYISPMITILTPIACLFAPVILAKMFGLPVNIIQLIKFLIKQLFSRNIGVLFQGGSIKTKLVTLFTVLMWLFYYIYGSYQTIMTAIHANKVINIFADRVRQIDQLINTAEDLNKQFGEMEIDLGIDVETEIKYFRGFLCCEPGWFKGGVLTAYYKLLENRERLIPIVNYLGMADMYCSIATLGSTVGYSIAEYDVGDNLGIKKPKLICKGVWHPSLDGKSAVCNDIEINSKHPNLLITGPNMGGKSTFIKSVLIAAIMAQTLGIVATRGEMKISPYSCFNSCLKIPDATGYVSQFEAEMYNNQKQLAMLNEIEEDKFVLSIIDEIFTSTNSLEGVSAAHAICEKLSSFPNCQSIITTHYTELTELEKITDGKFLNYRFGVNRDNDGEIRFPYKIEKGISRDYIALELLKRNKFDPAIVKCAQNRLKRLVDEKIGSVKETDQTESVKKKDEEIYKKEKICEKEVVKVELVSKKRVKRRGRKSKKEKEEKELNSEKYLSVKNEL